MRNLMKRRRVLSRGFNPYAAILATEPDLFVGLEYNVIGDQQVLWQDAAGTTTPVVIAANPDLGILGDPIGCVRHPLTGAIVASQATSSRRPLWGGPGVGAIHTNATQRLTDENVMSPGLGSFVAVVTLKSSSTATQFFLTQRASVPGWSLYSEGGTLRRLVRDIDGGGGFVSSGAPIPVGEPFILALEVDRLVNEARMRINNVTILTTDIAGLGSLSPGVRAEVGNDFTSQNRGIIGSNFASYVKLGIVDSTEIVEELATLVML